MFGNVNFDQFSLFANPAVKSLWSLTNVSAKDIQIYELTVIVQRLELYNSALKSYSELSTFLKILRFLETFASSSRELPPCSPTTE